MDNPQLGPTDANLVEFFVDSASRGIRIASKECPLAYTIFWPNVSFLSHIFVFRHNQFLVSGGH